MRDQLKYQFVLTFLVLAFSGFAAAANLSVQPLYLEFTPSKQLKSKNFEISVSSEQAVKIKTSLFQAQQDITGKLSFTELLGEKDQDAIVTLKKNSYQIKRDSNAKIRGTIKFPRRTNKTLLYAVMIEEDKGKSRGGVSINVRYAVILKVQTSHRKTRIKSKLSFIGLQKTDQGMLIKALIKNESQRDFRINAMAKIRNSERRLIETIELRSGSAWQRQDKNSIIFPEGVVELVGKLNKISSPGEYNVALYGRIDNRKPVSARGIIEIKAEEMERLNSEKASDSPNYVVSPTPFNIKYKEKGESYYRFQISNNTDKKVTVDMPMMNKEHLKKYEFSFLPVKMSLRAGSKRTVLFKVRNKIGPELKINGLKALITSAEGTQVQDIALPVSFITE